ncbi:MAG: TIM barrel protein [Nitrospiraceae bacterium]|nr:TIM barrel protein [Nitrospiraceae bacterium]
MDLKPALAKAKEIGAHGVQLWVAHNELDPRNLSTSGRDELVSYMASLGLERSALCGDIGGFADPATVDERIAHTKEMFDLCVDLKTPILTTHIGVVPEDKDSPAYGALVDAVREVANYAAERECCFATETGPESGENLAGFLALVDSPGAKVNYDPANLCMAGFDQIGDVRALKNYIAHTHAKDGIRNQPQEVALGKGDVDFPAYVAVLREVGYSGYLTVERECGDDPLADIIEAVSFLRTLEGVDQ